METYEQGKFIEALAALLEAEPTPEAASIEVIGCLKRTIGLTENHLNQVGRDWLKRAVEIPEEQVPPEHVAETTEAGTDAMKAQPAEEATPE